MADPHEVDFTPSLELAQKELTALPEGVKPLEFEWYDRDKRKVVVSP
jgi:hypothetical protein